MQKVLDRNLKLGYYLGVMNNQSLTQEVAQQILAKAESDFKTNRFGSKFAKTLGLAQPYVSHLKSLAQSGNSVSLPQHAVEKFLDYLSGSTVETNDSKVQLFMSLRENGKFTAGQEVTETQLKEQFAPTEAKSTERNEKEVLADALKAFTNMRKFIGGVATGKFTSMIVAGAAGVGKTYNVEEVLAETVGADGYQMVGGSARATGIYKALFKAREGGLVVFDDVDVFGDLDTLNIFKRVLDTSKARTVSNLSEGRWMKDFAEEMGVELDDVRSFEFTGSVIFLTNVDFDRELAKDSKLSPHINALLDRSFYIDMKVHNAFEKMVWIDYIFTNKIATKNRELTEDDVWMLSTWFKENYTRLRSLSIRTMVKATQAYLIDDRQLEMMEVGLLK